MIRVKKWVDRYSQYIDFILNSEINSKSIVGLYITGFTIPDIFTILQILKENKNVKTLYVFYTEPKHYLFKDTVFDTYEYLRGERRYESIPGYTSIKSDPELLVCFLGFDNNVSNVLFDKVIPVETITINGFPSYLPKLKDISLLNNYSLLTKIDRDSQLYTRANNPFSSYNTLCEIRKNIQMTQQISVYQELNQWHQGHVCLHPCTLR
eukprot:TRINITY_DN7286_c0_g1_i6.p1 TRINITY_DN7286_c0_g1~~TRINITY_DN7286_c0_g1_i6.p1  ORF type:complete len:209 (-),score=4.45 TRINITY_DN7286_c0_g1_i6:202-828(-)